VVGEVYLPNGTKDSTFPDFSLTERGSSGTYVGEFTPDELGNWQVVVHLASGDGQVTKRYSVGSYDVTGVGVAVEGVSTQLDSIGDTVNVINTAVASLDTPPMIS